MKIMSNFMNRIISAWIDLTKKNQGTKKLFNSLNIMNSKKK